MSKTIFALLILLLAGPAWSANYEVYCANAGVPATGLTLTWETLKLRSDGSDIGSPPSLSEVGGGWYKYSAAPTAGQVWIGAVDCGATLADADRYVAVRLSPEDVFLDIASSTRAPEAGGNLADVKAKTELIPTTPADETTTEAARVAAASMRRPRFHYATSPIQTRGITAGVIARGSPSYVEWHISTTYDFGNSWCKLPSVPDACCTGNGTGTCTGPDRIEYDIYYYDAAGHVDIAPKATAPPNP